MKRILLPVCVGVYTLLLGFGPLKSLALQVTDPAWINPSHIALKNVVPAHIPARYHTLQTENLECQDMEAGCYIQTAFGMQDAESSHAVFAGTNGTPLPVIPFIGGQVLVGWPGTDTVLALTSIPTGGIQIGLYRFFTSTLVDQLNPLGQITGKRVGRAPDFNLTDNTGHILLFNANTLAFSDNGSWLVAETLNNGFVRINLATLRVTTVTSGYSSLGSSPGLKESQLAVSDDGQFVSIANRTASNFKVFDLSQCNAEGCASQDYWPFLAAQLPTSFVPIHLRFINSQLLGFRTNVGPLEASYLLAPTDHIGSLLAYLGLGDSYTAGEGIKPFRLGTDTDTNHCHLSELSYPLLIRDVLFTTMSANSVACSGSRIPDIDAGGQSNISSDASRQALSTFTPGHVPQSAFVSQYQPAIVTTGIGGNDIGFGSIVTQCVMPKTRDTSCYSTYEDRLELATLIDRTTPKLARLYKKLQGRTPLGKLYVLGYPQIVTPGNCALNVHLDASEIQLAIFLIDHLNVAVSEAARQAGAEYIDVSQAFAGHRLCEADSSQVAMNGLTAGDDGGFVLPEPLGGGKVRFLDGGSYHPNAYGQQLLSQFVLGRLRGASNASSKPYAPATTDTTGLLDAPKIQRRVSALQFANFTDKNILPGGNISIQLSGLGFGLRPNSDYTIHLDGLSGPVIGIIRTDPSGDLNGSLHLPVIDGGVHSIDITGPNQAGETTDIRQIVTVADLPSTEMTVLGTISSTPSIGASQPPLATLSEGPNEHKQGRVLGATTNNPNSGTPHRLPTSPGNPTSISGRPPIKVIPWLNYLYILVGLWTMYVLLRLVFGREPSRALSR